MIRTLYSTTRAEESESGGEAEESDSGGTPEPANQPMTTRSGRAINPPIRMNLGAVELTNTELGYYKRDDPNQNYYNILAGATQNEMAEGEVAVVGAGIGGGFQNTSELRVMTYDEAMKTEDRSTVKKKLNTNTLRARGCVRQQNCRCS